MKRKRKEVKMRETLPTVSSATQTFDQLSSNPANIMVFAMIAIRPSSREDVLFVKQKSLGSLRSSKKRIDDYLGWCFYKNLCLYTLSQTIKWFDGRNREKY